MKIWFNIEGRKFSCTECPYIVDRQDRLKTHQEKKHSKSVTSRFQCTYCQKDFSTRSHLKDHEKTHVTLPVQSKNFECDVCNKSFASEKSLYVHKHKFHNNTKVVNSLGFGVFEDSKPPIKSSNEKFQCHKCGYSTERSHNLKLHLEKKNSCVVKKSYSCDKYDYTSYHKGHFEFTSLRLPEKLGHLSIRSLP